MITKIQFQDNRIPGILVPFKLVENIMCPSLPNVYSRFKCIAPSTVLHIWCRQLGIGLLEGFQREVREGHRGTHD